MSKKVYLDYAAATPVDEDVIKAMQPYLIGSFYNPSALYGASKEVKLHLEEARSVIARHLGAKPSEIAFTSGATEANNLAIKGILDNFPDSKVAISAIEHESVLESAGKYGHVLLGVDRGGFVKLGELEKISDETVLISIILANNEIGVIQPMSEISKVVDEVRKSRLKRGVSRPLYLHSDATQAVLYTDINVSHLGVDLMTINSGKIYGPKGCGALFVKAGTVLAAQNLGGGQEYGLRSGTENVPAIIGFAKAFELARSQQKSELRRLTDLRNYFLAKLDQLGVDYELNGSPKNRLANNLNICIQGVDNEVLLFALDEAGVMVATGSACSASNDEPSHVLSAIGLEENQIRSSIRVTMGRHTTKSDVDYATEQIKKVAKLYCS